MNPVVRRMVLGLTLVWLCAAVAVMLLPLAGPVGAVAAGGLPYLVLALGR